MNSLRERINTYVVKIIPSLLPLACLAIFVSAFSTPAKAINLVTNGSFETTSLSSPGGGYFCQAGSTCISNVAGWNSVCRNNSCGNGATPTSLLFANSNGGNNGSAFNGGIGLQGTSTTDPNGGNYVAADADSAYNSVIYQQITGLVAGQSYVLNFYQAGAQQKGASGNFTENWAVSFGTSVPTNATAPTTLSQAISVTGGAQTAWSLQTMILTATNATEYLGFLATSSSGAPPVALLDGVSLTATPEPSTFVLALASLGGLGVYVRRRRAARS